MPSSYRLTYFDLQQHAEFWLKLLDEPEFARGEDPLRPHPPSPHSLVCLIDGKPAGLWTVNPCGRAGQAEVGCAALPEFRRAEFYEVFWPLIKTQLATMGYNRLWCRILPHREALAKRLLGWGWVLEGRLNLSCRIHGKLSDELQFAYLIKD
jgi:hypothetical protein